MFFRHAPYIAPPRNSTVMRLMPALAALALAAMAPAAALEPDSVFEAVGSGYVLQDGPPVRFSASLSLETGPASGGEVPFSVSGTVSSKNTYSVSSAEAASMREGRFLRVSAELSSSAGSAGLGALGKLVGQEGGHWLYFFSGRISEGGQSHRVAWVARVAQEEGAQAPADADATVRITPGPGSNFEPTQLSMERGQTLAFVNGDTETRRVVSGTVTNERNPTSGVPCTTAETPADFVKIRPGRTGGCNVVHDGKTDVLIRPGGSAGVTFDEPGTHRFVNPDDPRMRLLVVVLVPS